MLTLVEDNANGVISVGSVISVVVWQRLLVLCRISRG